MVLGHHVQPRLKILHPVFVKFGDGLKKNLLYAVLGLDFVSKVLHAHAEKQKRVPLE